MDPQNNPAPICIKSCSVAAQTGCPDGYVCEQFWTDFDNGVCLPAQ
jgi:hypothetical protein